MRFDLYVLKFDLTSYCYLFFININILVVYFVIKVSF